MKKDRVRDVLSRARALLERRKQELMRDIIATPQGCDSRPAMIREHDEIAEVVGECAEVLK